MIRTKLAKKTLTKAEQKHLTESGINSMDSLKRQVNFIKKHIADAKTTGEPCFPCFECKHIAIKLNAWEDK